MRGATNIIISPDGDLHLVSFATLKKDRRFLVEDCSIRYMTSGRSLLKAPSRPSSRQVEIWADPAFDDSPAERTMASSFMQKLQAAWWGQGTASRAFFQGTFSPLRYTADEAAALQKVAIGWGLKANLHLGAAASKSELMKVQHPLVLHLATHGFFVGSEVAGTNDSLGIAPPMGKWTGQALMQGSGIALAGANRTVAAAKRAEVPPFGAEGVVFADEMATLDLQDTWIATLSACDTGVGELADGEGVLALNTALFQAGARNALFTLWRVNDRYAVNFMRDFYSAALASGDPPQALCDLQRRELAASSGRPLWERVKLAGPFVMTTAGNTSARPSVLR